jgi:hypothetical protein
VVNEVLPRLAMNDLRLASYDGEIILWIVETGLAFMKFDGARDLKPTLISTSYLTKQTVR